MMGEHGSFSTEWLYCDRCLEAAKEVFMAEGDFDVSDTPIGQSVVSGRIGGAWCGEELLNMEMCAEKLGAKICHPMRVAVFSEGAGEQMFAITPGYRLELSDEEPLGRTDLLGRDSKSLEGEDRDIAVLAAENRELREALAIERSTLCALRIEMAKLRERLETQESE